MCAVLTKSFTTHRLITHKCPNKYNHNHTCRGYNCSLSKKQERKLSRKLERRAALSTNPSVSGLALPPPETAAATLLANITMTSVFKMVSGAPDQTLRKPVLKCLTPGPPYQYHQTPQRAYMPKPDAVVQQVIGAPARQLALPAPTPVLLLAAPPAVHVEPTLWQRATAGVAEWAGGITWTDAVLYLMMPMFAVIAFYGGICLLAIALALVIA